MKRSLIVFLILLTAAGIVQAQSPDKIRQELERTDAIIQQARAIVEPANNPDAQLLLNQAIELQQTAWDGYRRKRYRWSYSRTLAARQRAREAMELISSDPERIAAEIQRTGELINQLSPDITRTEDPQTTELWKMVQAEQGAALNYFRARRWRLALRFTIAARNHLYELIQKTKRVRSREAIQTELDRTDLILKRIAEPVAASNNLRAQEMYTRAGQWQLQAKNLFRSRMHVPAIKLTFAAREHAFRAWQQLFKNPDSTIVNSALAETEHLIAQWSEKISQQQNEELNQLLGAAIDHQKTAQELYSQGNLTGALQYTGQARQILYRAIELYNRPEPVPNPD
jgi:hypothetical protein